MTTLDELADELHLATLDPGQRLKAVNAWISSTEDIFDALAVAESVYGFDDGLMMVAALRNDLTAGEAEMLALVDGADGAILRAGAESMTLGDRAQLLRNRLALRLEARRNGR